jgi:thiamine pyrophosphate-dependent acetolactate synthase large subunit-like protein
MFAAGRPRPAHLQVPVDALSAPCGARGEDAGAAPRPPRAAAAGIERAARLLAGAARPLVIAGGGAIGAGGAGGALPRLAERLGAPVLLTVAAKGLLPDRHPLSLGATLPERPAQALLARADVVLALGTELSETDHWAPRLDIPGRVVRVDLDGGKLDDPVPAELPLLADAGRAAADILDALGQGPPAGWDGRAAEEVSAVRRAVDAAAEGAQPGFRSALRALREALPPDAVLATDMTQLAYAANVHFPVDRPRSYLHPVGFGTLGYALPAAIGAKVALPDRPVVAVAGDGGLLFTVAELGTAVELGLSLPIVLWDNNGLGQIRDDMIARQMPQIGVNPRNPDYLALARAFGAEAVEVSGPRALASELGAALARPCPTLLRVLAPSFP